MQFSDGLPPPRRLAAFLALATGILMAVLDGAIVNVALPSITRDLGVAPADAVWIVTAYQLSITVSLLPLSSLGEIVGYRWVFWGGLVLFTLASLVCALSGSLTVLVLARAVQGLGGAGMMGVNGALIRFIFPQARLGRALGNVALVVATAAAGGPTVASVILAVAPWQWLFFVNVPVGLVALVIAIRNLPATPRARHRFDLPSVALNAATFGLLIMGIDGLGGLRGGDDFRPLIELAAAAVIGYVFTRRQMTLPAPMLPVDLLQRPVFALSVVTSICTFSAQALAYVSLPFFFQDGLGFSEVTTGLLMSPWPMAVAFAAPVAGRLVEHYSPARLCSLGLGVMSSGLLLLACLPAAPSVVDIVWRLVVCGLGFGLSQSPNNQALFTSAPKARAGGASGMQSTARLVGQSVGVALVAVVFALFPGHSHTVTLTVAAGFALTGVVASALRRFK